MKIFQSLFIIFLFIPCISVFAQKETTKNHRSQIRGAIMMANSHVSKASEGDRKVLLIPTWGLDIDYFFHPRWSTAIQGDIMIQDFDVEEKNTDLERAYPVALAAVIHYHALRHWSFYAGPGYELESHENLFLIKMGTEYSFEITENFEIALNLNYQNKQEVYDSWTFGIAFNKRLWYKKDK